MEGHSASLPYVFHNLGGCGPPLLLMHATGFHGRMYAPIAQGLQNSYTCWAVDFPGHGANTAAVKLPLTAGHLAASLVSNLQQHGLMGGHVFGHSGGAAVALVAEALFPGTFRSLFVYEPVASTPTIWVQLTKAKAATSHNTGDLLASLARKRRSTYGSPQEAMAHLSSKPPFRHMQPAVVQLYVQYGLLPRPQQGSMLQQHHQQRAQAAVCADDTASAQPSSSRGSSIAGMLGIATGSPLPAVSITPLPSSSPGCQDSSDQGSDPTTTWQLACPPEVEAAYYQVFNPTLPIPPKSIKCPLCCAASAHAASSSSSSSSGAAQEARSPGSTAQPTASSTTGDSRSNGRQPPGSAQPMLHGELPALVAALAASQPDACYLPFPALSHFGPFEDPARVAAALQQFLGRAAARTGSKQLQQQRCSAKAGSSSRAAPLIDRTECRQHALAEQQQLPASDQHFACSSKL